MIEHSHKELEVFARASLEAVKTVETAELNNQTNETYIKKHDRLLRAFHDLANNFSRVTNIRITYLDANGNVLGDSGINFTQLLHTESHKNRSEILSALEIGMGIATRYSNSLKGNMLYVAVRSDERHHTNKTSNLSHPLIARASRSQSLINAAIFSQRKNLLLMGLLSIMIILMISYVGIRLLLYIINQDHDSLEKRVNKRTLEISNLQTISGLLNACSTLEEAGNVIRLIAPKLIPDVLGSISIINASRNFLETVVKWGDDWPGINKFGLHDCWALRKGSLHISTNNNIQILCNHWSNDNISQSHTVCIPLMAQGETIGVMHLVMEDQTIYTSNQQLWNTLAEQTGLALANIQLRDNLRELAVRDPLTGLFNRRYLEESLDQAFSRSIRQNETMAVLMIDLDHFKLLNDKFGHEAGDQVIKSFAKIIKSSTRNEDIACRFGGEEFCIVCPCTDEQEALLVVERISKDIRSLEIDINQLSIGTVTTSIGIALFPYHANNIDDLMKAADDALYLSKKSGRDRTEVAKATIDNNRKGVAGIKLTV